MCIKQKDYVGLTLGRKKQLEQLPKFNLGLLLGLSHGDTYTKCFKRESSCSLIGLA
eukprot:c43079_g1_i1 orf=1-165(-)